VTLIDITVPIRPRMPIYDRNPGVRLERVLSIAHGEAANVCRLELGCHTGTHVDAPVHFIEGAPGAEELPLDPLVGEAVVVDATALDGPIDAEALRSCSVPEGAERVLLKTRNGRLWAREEFTRDFIRLDGAGARWLVDRGVRLIGLDYLSIGDQEAHRVLLGAGVVPLEGIDLRDVEPGWYELLCLPLKVVGADGAPARALLRPLGG
jgi:arylformamidase